MSSIKSVLKEEEFLYKLQNSQIYCDAVNIGKYEMTQTPSGLAVIYEFETFSENVLKQRKGSHHDVERCARLFNKLNFSVKVEQNLTENEFLKSLKNLSKREDHKNSDAFILVLLSHGLAGFIHTSDCLSVDTEDIFQMFNNANCPNLRKKPKLFFIQACRGNKLDPGYEENEKDTFVHQMESMEAEQLEQQVQTTQQAQYLPNVQSEQLVQLGQTSNGHIGSLTSTTTDALPFSSKHSSRHQSWQDMLMVYSTVPKHACFRREDEGSWFIKSLVEIFEEHAEDDHVEDLIKATNVKLAKLQTEFGKKQSLTFENRNFNKKLYFKINSQPDQLFSSSSNAGRTLKAIPPQEGFFLAAKNRILRFFSGIIPQMSRH